MPAKEPASAEEALGKLNPRQRKFVVEYMNCLNATQAARRAGYKEHTARFAGCENLTKPNIKQAIAALGEELGMSAGEAFKHVTDIAKSRLQDYMIIREVERIPRVRKPLQFVIDQIQAEIDLEEQYMAKAKLGPKQIKRIQIEQEDRQNQLIRLRLELAQNPNATRLIDGEPEMVKEARIDMVALAKAEGEGRIKSLTYTEFGPKVELESASNALDTVLRIHGRFVQKHEVKESGKTRVYIDPETKSVIIEDVEEDN